jgi:hypothetical protein
MLPAEQQRHDTATEVGKGVPVPNPTFEPQRQQPVPKKRSRYAEESAMVEKYCDEKGNPCFDAPRPNIDASVLFLLTAARLTCTLVHYLHVSHEYMKSLCDWVHLQVPGDG